jgi:hypothetical protein
VGDWFVKRFRWFRSEQRINEAGRDEEKEDRQPVAAVGQAANGEAFQTEKVETVHAPAGVGERSPILTRLS